jgi:NRAMP (natural resistance-associated macrophage protein)-like metal ion transporter
MPEIKKKKTLLGRILRIIGPGFITGASDDDPSGIGTYAQTGAIFGFRQLWTILFSFPFMVVIQEMCGRIGMITGTGLSGVIKKNYGKKILYPLLLLLVAANVINIGADLGAMAASAQMLFGKSFVGWLILMTLITLLLIVFVPYNTYVRYLKFLSISLFGYIFTVFIVKQDWHEVLKATFIPSISMDKEYLMNFVAILGTTISPYLFFWQADEEVEEEIKEHRLEAMGAGKPRIFPVDLKMMRFDTAVGMFFSNLISFFVIDATAATLHVHGITNIQTTTDAAGALKPLAGNFAYMLFAIGIIGTGLMAVPVLAGSAGYAIAEAAKWRAGLFLKFRQAPRFYLIIVVSVVLGVLIHYCPFSPFELLYYTAILNGLAAPPIMLIILLICNNKKIMGANTNPLIINILAIFITIVMAAAAIAMLIFM